MKKYLAIVIAMVFLVTGACARNFDTVYKVTFERLGAIGPSQRYTVDSKDRRITLETTEYGGFSDGNETYWKKELLWSDEKWEGIKELLKKYQVQNWEDEYKNDEIYDGEYWTVRIENAADETIEKHGVNDYPENWDKFAEDFESVVSGG